MYNPIPTKLIDIQQNIGYIDIGNNRYPVQLHFLKSAQAGDYVLVQMGFAIQTIREHDKAEKTYPSLIDIRSGIEQQLAENNFTILLTSSAHIEKLHTSGIRYILPSALRFLYGPGCPTCLTPVGYFQNVFHLAQKQSVILVTFSDVMNMPTPAGTLHMLRQDGYDIRVVHSPYDVLRIAEWNPKKEVVLAAVGCDVMAAVVGIAIKEAMSRDIRNLSFFSSLQRREILLREHILRSNYHIDGVVCSAYDVSVDGSGFYSFIIDELKRGCCCTGVDAGEILRGILNMIRQTQNNDFSIYQGPECVCSQTGNAQLRSIIDEVFITSDNRWSSGDLIERSKYILRDDYNGFDAEKKFTIPHDELLVMPGCSNREIQLGLILPYQCSKFATQCHPGSPIGAGMLSSEGLCYTWYNSSYKFKMQSNK